MMGRVARSQKMLKLHGNIDDILSDAIDCASNAIYCDQFGRFFWCRIYYLLRIRSVDIREQRIESGSIDAFFFLTFLFIIFLYLFFIFLFIFFIIFFHDVKSRCNPFVYFIFKLCFRNKIMHQKFHIER